MNKVSVISLIACTLAAPSVMAKQSDHEGVVRFEGHVVSNSCSVDHGDKHKNINLLHALTSEIKPKTAVKIKEFNIRVSDCYVAGKVKPNLYWTSGTNLDADGNMLNSVGRNGSNAALMLMDSDEKPINLHRIGTGIEPDKEGHGDRSFNGGLTYSFKVGYVKAENRTSDPVTPGPLMTQASYTVEYK